MAYASFVITIVQILIYLHGLDKPYSTITVDYQEETQDSSDEEDSTKDDAECYEASDDGKETLEESRTRMAETSGI
ncbi:MAG: hypothetical protein ACLUGD_03735 [Ruminococcus sp.]